MREVVFVNACYQSAFFYCARILLNCCAIELIMQLFSINVAQKAVSRKMR